MIRIRQGSTRRMASEVSLTAETRITTLKSYGLPLPLNVTAASQSVLVYSTSEESETTAVAVERHVDTEEPSSSMMTESTASSSGALPGRRDVSPSPAVIRISALFSFSKREISGPLSSKVVSAKSLISRSTFSFKLSAMMER